MPRALVIHKAEGKPGKVYYPLAIEHLPTPTPGPKDLQIAIHACALNHRDLFLRQHLYPGVAFSVPLLADGVGTVLSSGSSLPSSSSASSSSSWNGKRVILTPAHGWASSPLGPEPGSNSNVLGGTKFTPLGTAQDVLVVSADEVEECPPHLSDAEAAALPLTGLTAWRALVTKSENFETGRNILITGIGGGVALNALQFAVAKGINVYVTSSSSEKLVKAKKLGAVGGVSYKSPTWEKELAKLLPKTRPWLDAVIDGAGGDVVTKTVKLLKQGGVIVSYGMTVSPKMDWHISAVLRNVDLKGSTMGSRKEFKEMIEFIAQKKVRPVVSRVVKGLDNLEEIEGLFQELKRGSQFGKLVIEVVPDKTASSKL